MNWINHNMGLFVLMIAMIPFVITGIVLSLSVLKDVMDITFAKMFKLK